ncbi:hypothetical protein GCK72_022363 [Caenorhabditis remanei]|uniref:Uncharacterized protein n=1 Tax=Caenorhabditis remanei TaxID=31234 RepID=A0A6A5FTU7_CAERE|nr:hypothetical protein GCK72_022363 [Caenorhabditis remanei]KAF1745916.1 hypothetical protein GCK72_022363 [Caenorhabditis remanei]
MLPNSKPRFQHALKCIFYRPSLNHSSRLFRPSQLWVYQNPVRWLRSKLWTDVSEMSSCCRLFLTRHTHSDSSGPENGLIRCVPNIPKNIQLHDIDRWRIEKNKHLDELTDNNSAKLLMAVNREPYPGHSKCWTEVPYKRDPFCLDIHHQKNKNCVTGLMRLQRKPVKKSYRRKIAHIC